MSDHDHNLLPAHHVLELRHSFIYVIIVLYTLVLMIGLLGNGLTCAVVLLNKSMRRSIHFYTFNLALADGLLLLLYVPTQMRMVYDHLYWSMGDVMCSFCNFTIQLTLSASIATLLAISIDRYRAILNPFSWRSTSLHHAKITIFIIWLVSAVFATPVAYYVKVVQWRSNETNDTNVYLICAEEWPQHTKYDVMYWTTVMMFQYVLPLLAITLINVRIVVQIKQSGDSINSLHRSMLRMVGLLLCTYTICTGMQHIDYIINYVRNTFNPQTFVVANLVVTLQAAVNPFVYGTLRTDFRLAIVKIMKNSLLTMCGRRKKKILEGSFRGLFKSFHSEDDASERNDLCPLNRLESLAFQERQNDHTCLNDQIAFNQDGIKAKFCNAESLTLTEHTIRQNHGMTYKTTKPCIIFEEDTHQNQTIDNYFRARSEAINYDFDGFDIHNLRLSLLEKSPESYL